MSRSGTGLRLAAILGAGVTAVAAVAGAGPVAASPSVATSPGGDDGLKFTGLKFTGTKTTMRMGPFNLAPAPLGNLPNQNRIVPDVAKPCTDCFITGIVPRLEYADGTRADMTTGVMLHHVVFADTSRPDATCDREDGIGAIGQRLFAAGDERTPFALPEGYGYPVRDGEWIGVIDLMNSSPLPREVYYTADVYHVPASTKGMKPVTPVWMDIENCGNSQYAVPAGRSSTSWAWTSNLTGRIVAAAGHVHAGGVGTVLRNATTGKRICSSEADYGMAGHDTGAPDSMAQDSMAQDSTAQDAMANMVTSMSLCTWDSLGTVEKGQTLELTSLYDTPQAMTGVMGIMLLAVAETENLEGGSKAPASMRATPDTKVPAGVATDHGMLGGIGGHGH